MSGLACPQGHTDDLYSVESALIHYPVRPAEADEVDPRGWEYTGDSSDTFDETAESVGNFHCGQCGEDFAWSPAVSSGSPAVPGDDDFNVGVPACVTVTADNRVIIEVYLGEVSMEAADEGATIAQTDLIAGAIAAGTAIIRPSKGA